MNEWICRRSESRLPDDFRMTLPARALLFAEGVARNGQDDGGPARLSMARASRRLLEGCYAGATPGRALALLERVSSWARRGRGWLGTLTGGARSGKGGRGQVGGGGTDVAAGRATVGIQTARGRQSVGSPSGAMRRRESVALSNARGRRRCAQPSARGTVWMRGTSAGRRARAASTRLEREGARAREAGEAEAAGRRGRGVGDGGAYGRLSSPSEICRSRLVSGGLVLCLRVGVCVGRR